MNKNHRVYPINESITFRKTKDTWGGFSNMAAGYPIYYKGELYKTAEAFYQSLKFDSVYIKNEIRTAKSPITAKKIAYSYSEYMLEGWYDKRYLTMDKVVRLKFYQNYDKLYPLFIESKDKYIVEFVHNIDDKWGCIKNGDNYIGVNALGRIIMNLRKEYFEFDQLMNACYEQKEYK